MRLFALLCALCEGRWIATPSKADGPCPYCGSPITTKEEI